MQKIRFALAGLACLLPGLGHAAVTVKDIQVAARVLAFSSTPPSGSVKLGIVYEPGNAASAADEQSLVTMLGSGLAVGGVTLVPVPVTMDQLGTASADVYFLTSGLSADGAKMGAAAAAKKMICITTDLSETQAGNCAVAVQSDPKVQITVSKAAAAASNVSFVSAFMLMVTEI